MGKLLVFSPAVRRKFSAVAFLLNMVLMGFGEEMDTAESRLIRLEEVAIPKLNIWLLLKAMSDSFFPSGRLIIVDGIEN